MYLELWHYMYDRYTNYHNLTNLIWVWNGQHKDWFPGADVVDIVGYDVYAPEREYGSLMNVFYQMVEEMMDEGTMKIIALTETGVIPCIDNMRADRAMWSHWKTWNGEFVIYPNTPFISSQFTELEQLIKMYDSEFVITLCRLPCLKSYPVEGME
jgi:mannan endo-1,4-beta-mannosidase